MQSIGRPLLVILLLLWTACAGAQQFARTYGGAGDEVTRALLQTVDGGYVLAGETESFGAGNRDVLAIRLDATGNIVWQRVLGGAGEDIAYKVVQTTDGGFVLAGSTESFGAGGRDAWIVKLDAGGTLLWNRTLGAATTEELQGLTATADGGVIACGSAQTGGVWDGLLVKFSAAGTVTWQRRYATSGNDSFYAVTPTSDGGYAVTGGIQVAGSGYDIWVVKTDGTGAITWQRRFGGSGDEIGMDLRQTTDGGYIVAGMTDSFGYLAVDGWLLKLDGAGNLGWQRAYGDAAPVSADAFFSVLQTPDGGYLLGGYTGLNAPSYDAWLLRLDTGGAITWQRAYGAGGTNTGLGLGAILTADGGYALTGSTTGYGAGFEDAWLIKCDSGGNLGGCGLQRSVNATTVVTTGSNASTTAASSISSLSEATPAPTVTTTLASLFVICAAAAAAAAQAVPALSFPGLLLLGLLLAFASVWQGRTR